MINKPNGHDFLAFNFFFFFKLNAYWLYASLSCSPLLLWFNSHSFSLLVSKWSHMPLVLPILFYFFVGV